MAAALGWWNQAREGEQRALAVALLASVAAHAVLLFAFPELKAGKPLILPGPLTARLVAPPAAAAPPPAPAPQTEESARPEAKRAPPRTEPRARPATAAPVAPASARTPSAEETPGLSAPTPGPEPAKPTAGPARASPAAPAPLARLEPQPAARPPGLDEASTLAQYRIAIMDAARRFKRYPRIALDNNWEGRVEVRLTVAPDGTVGALGVKTSAGHEVLDRQALDMIRQAKSLTPVPPALRGREVTVDVPVIFSLNEPDA